MLAEVDAEPRGCIAMGGNNGQVCETKRLYASEPKRALGLGRQLVDIVMRSALHPVYITMRLDTLLAMFSAKALYASEGFEELSAYYQSPIAGMVLMQGDLRAWERRQHGRQSNED